MLTSAALVLSLYALTRLTPTLLGTGRIGHGLERFFAALTIVAAVIVAVDATLVGTTTRGLSARLATTEPPAPTVERPTATAPVRPTVSVTRTSGGSIRTPLGLGFVVAKGSTLTREWIALHDPTVPVALEGTPGVTTAYVREGGYSGAFRYRAAFAVTPREPITALEVRFIVFDVWGTHVRTLEFSTVQDLSATTRQELSGQWPMLSENEVEAHYASIAYVSKVRLQNGSVVEAQAEPVVVEAQKFSKQFAPKDLEPVATQKS